MADDWKPGDLALCVKQGRWRSTLTGRYRRCSMRAGQVHTVRRFGMCPMSGVATLWLEGFLGERGADGFAAVRFRKIRPHTPDEQDEETIRLLTGAPVKEPANA